MRPSRDRARPRPRRGLAALLLAAAALLIPAIGTAQAPATATLDAATCARSAPSTAPLQLDPFRLAALRGLIDDGPTAVARGSTRRLRCPVAEVPGAGGLGAELLPVAGVVQHNTGYPRSLLTGLRWSGRGISLDVAGGVAAAWGPFSAALAPTFAYHENRDFETLEVNLPGTSPYAWYWRPTAIDWPQRFGPEAFWWSHAGESYIRLDAFGAAAGFSTERLRWGPGQRYGLLMSGGAPGFPHVFVGTSRPVDIRIGELFVEAVWGHLHESDHFDGDADNDTRVLGGLVAGLAPRWLPGMSIGVTRAVSMTLPPEGWSLLDYLIEPYADILTNRPTGTFEGENDLASVFVRWVYPAVEFEAYLEFARDDLWDGWIDLLMEPEHSAAILFGAQKLVPVGGDDDPRRLRFAAEVTSLNFSETQRSTRAETIIYTHSHVRQGHTHRGRMLGTPTGPSSDAQSIELDFLARSWMAGLHVERVRYANDIYWQVHGFRYSTFGHDLEVTGGLRGGVALQGGLELVGDLSWSGRYNRDFVALHGTLYQTGYERNLSLQLGASWRPASVRSAAADGPWSPSMRP